MGEVGIVVRVVQGRKLLIFFGGGEGDLEVFKEEKKFEWGFQG